MTGTFSEVPPSSWRQVLAAVRPSDPDSGLGCDRVLLWPLPEAGPRELNLALGWASSGPHRIF